MFRWLLAFIGPIRRPLRSVDPLSFYMALRRDPEGAHQVFGYVTRLKPLPAGAKATELE